MTSEGYGQLEIYQLARSLAALLQNLTLFALEGLPFESGAQLRHSSKTVVEEIVNSYLRRAAREEYLVSLQRARVACDETLNHLSRTVASGKAASEQLPYVISTYQRLGEMIGRALALDVDAPDSPFRVREEIAAYVPTLALSGDGRSLLEGKVFLLTRTLEQNQPMIRLLDQHGAYSTLLPTIEIVDPDSWDECDNAIVNLRKYDGIFFTSRNAVERFLTRIDGVNRDAKAILQNRPVYAVGEKTEQALQKAAVPVALAPEIYSAEDLAASLDEEQVAGKRLLFPRSSIGKDILPNALRSLDAVVDEVVVYKTVSPKQGALDGIRNSLVHREIDVVTFFSPSSVRNFLQLMGTKCIEGALVAVIGPTTARAAEEVGIAASIVARQATAESLVATVAEHFR